MNDNKYDNLELELKTKKICRFCLSQDDGKLSNLYSRENRLKSSAPLPLQVMACVSIEVFTNDGMPSTVCDNCRMLMEHCYRFKQMCKKADTSLRQFPLTGTWPQQLELPKIPEDLIRLQIPNPKILNTGIKVPHPIKLLQTTPEKPKSSGILLHPKLLNKNSIKILNKEATIKTEPVLSQPVIKHKKDGAVEIVTEIVENLENYEELDPIKSASPVETNVFPCPHCERSFPLRQLLDIHLVNHSRERSFECDLCLKKFFSKYDLGKHSLIHSGEKPFQCVVCSKSFTRSTLLQRHEKVHTDIPKFLCVYCEKPFLSKDELEKHTERHKKNRPFSCKICSKSFAFKQGLERHEVVHAKDQPFPCQYCNLSFPTPSKLSRHLTAHAGSRPYPCKLCPKSYLLSHHLSRHLRSHKEGTGSYKCYDCQQSFSSRDNLIYHSAVHATQNLICPLCKEHFDDLDLVTDHIKMHAEGEQYACEFCDLIFMTADKLQDHSDAQHTDDLEVYEEHTRNNLKIEKNEAPNIEICNETQVLEEFFIEEYEDEDSHPIISNIVKEETEVNAPSVFLNVGKRARSDNKNSKPIEFIDYNDDIDEEEKLFEELIEEPPSKIVKSNIQTNVKQQNINTELTLTKIQKTPPKNIVRDARVVKDKIVRKPESVHKNLSIIDGVIDVSSEESKQQIIKKPIQGQSSRENAPQKKLIEMVIGDRMVKVEKLTVTKAQANLMAKQGKINFDKNGTMILKRK